MKKSFQFILTSTAIVFLGHLTIHAQVVELSTAILDDSYVVINGTSNVNTFQCTSGNSFHPDTLQHQFRIDEEEMSIKGDSLNVYIESFDCGKKGITRDFRKTLKSDAFPNINIELLDIIYTEEEITSAFVEIELAGIAKTYMIDVETKLIDGKAYQIIGRQIIKLSDFNLEPPKALFGMVRVRDEMDVSIVLNVKQ